MRTFLAASLFSALASAAFAQELTPLPEGAPLAAEVEANLLPLLPENRFIDGFVRWQADLVGDAHPDQLVQAVIGYDGGNGYSFEHYIFIGNATGFSAFFPITLNGPISAVRLEDQALVFTLSTYIDGDARCCPSGTEVLRMPLR